MIWTNDNSDKSSELVSDFGYATGWVVQYLSKRDIEEHFDGSYQHLLDVIKPGWYISTPTDGYPWHDDRCVLRSHIMGWVYPTRKAAKAAVMILRSSFQYWDEIEGPFN